MKDFYTKHKMRIIVVGIFAAAILVLLTLSFGDTGAIATN
jgi:hypothetical protein